jgi:pimeloyl-ACP methyl ester carboxylesterase
MSIASIESSTTAPTQLIKGTGATYAYRRFGGGLRRPLVCLQHFTGTLDNWDPAVTDALAADREVILFDNAGVGRSTGTVPGTVAGMTAHALDFVDALCLPSCDLLGFSLGGMVAQEIALQRPSIVHRMVLVGTAPRGGEDIMHLDKPTLAKHLNDPSLKGYSVLQKIFFTESASSQSAGAAFVERLMRRTTDRDAPAAADVAPAQLAAFREWEQPTTPRFDDLHRIHQPTLIVNGIHDDMIAAINSYRLAEHLPNAVLLVYPNAGHGALFQSHDCFTRQAAAFLGSTGASAAY